MKTTSPDITPLTQPKTELCWATCICMVRKALKPAVPEITPDKLAERTFYADKGVNISGKDHIITAAVEAVVGKCSYDKRSLTWDEVKKEIDDNKPIMVGYGWEKGGGHAMILCGYEPKGDGSWGLVRLIDPLDGKARDVSHDRLCKGNYETDGTPGGSKGHKWDATWRF